MLVPACMDPYSDLGGRGCMLQVARIQDAHSYFKDPAVQETWKNSLKNTILQKVKVSLAHFLFSPSSLCAPFLGTTFTMMCVESNFAILYFWDASFARSAT